MSNRLQNSWELVKASAKVLEQDKRLLVFPLLSALASVLLVVSFFVPIVAVDSLRQAFDRDQGTGLAAALMFGFYLLQYFVIFFANAALVGATLIRLRGGTPTVGEGLRIAARHIGSIFVYALISATVGMVLRAIAERAGFIGRLITGLIGAAWSIATFLTVPVLVSEEIGPVDAISRSMALLKQSWGEQVVAGAGIGIVFNWLLILSMVLFAGGIWLTAGVFNSPIATMPVCGLLFVWVLGLCLLRATLSGIFAAALYRFAAEGEVGSAFDPQLIQSAFRPTVRSKL